MEVDNMSDTTNNNLEVILVRMEAKLDRFGDRMTRFEADMVLMRQGQHDLRNDMTPLIMLDIPARIRVADVDKAEVHARLAALESTENQRKGAAGAIKVMWAIAVAVGVSGVAAVVRVLQLGGI